MPIDIPKEAILDRLGGPDVPLWTDGWGDYQDPKAETCLHGAIRYCQLVPGDAYLIEQVAARDGWGTRANDDADEWGEVWARVPGEVTDADLRATFGPGWEGVVEVVRQAAALTSASYVAYADAAYADAAFSADAAASDAAYADASFSAASAYADAASAYYAAYATYAASAAYASGASDAAAYAARAAAVAHLVGRHGLEQHHIDTLTAPWAAIVAQSDAEKGSP